MTWDLTKEAPHVAVLVALREEFAELRQGIGTQWEVKQDEEFGGKVYAWVDPDSGARCLAAWSGRAGTTEAGHFAHKLLRYRPAVLVNVGIAASLHADVRIGDVVVPDMIYAYDKTGKAVPIKDASGREGWSWEKRGDAFRATHHLVEMARELVMADPGLYSRWQDDGAIEYKEIRGNNSEAFRAIDEMGTDALCERPEVRVACLGSGDFEGEAPAFVEWIRATNAEIKALEMEAAGMLLSAEKRSAPIPTLVIRGISDHKDVPKLQSDKIERGALRRLAMRNAVRLLRTLLALPEFVRRSESSGLTYSDVKEIARETMRNDIATLSAEAMHVVSKRISNFVETVVGRLSERGIEPAPFLDPDVQYAMLSAQRAAARTQDRSKTDVLANLLVARVASADRDLEKVVLNEAINITEKLTPDQFDALALIFATEYAGEKIATLTGLQDYIERIIAPTMSSASHTWARIQHLKYSGCVAVRRSSVSLEKLWGRRWPELFITDASRRSLAHIGIPKRMPDGWDAAFAPGSKPDTLTLLPWSEVQNLYPRVNDSSNSYVTAQEFWSKISEYAVGRLRRGGINTPSYAGLLNFWNTFAHGLTLTSVGIALAHASLRRRGLCDSPLSDWIE